VDEISYYGSDANGNVVRAIDAGKAPLAAHDRVESSSPRRLGIWAGRALMAAPTFTLKNPNILGGDFTHKGRLDVTMPFGMADLDRGELARPDDRRDGQRLLCGGVAERHIARPGVILSARDHGDPKQTVSFADPAFGDDERRPVLPRRSIGIGKGEADAVALLKAWHKPSGPLRHPIRRRSRTGYRSFRRLPW
jgi:hypothetical protein